MIRVKLKCKNPKKSPLERVMEMGDKLYLINFTAEGVDQTQRMGKDEDGDDNDGGDGKGDEDMEEDDLLGDEPSGVGGGRRPP